MRRRTLLAHTGKWAIAASAAPLVARSQAAAEPAPGLADTVLAQQWRAVSRIGYGPSELLLADVRAAKHPREWALEQIDRAYAASQTLPALTPDVQAINAPLPELFAHLKREREARAGRVAGQRADAHARRVRRDGAARAAERGAREAVARDERAR